MTNGLPEGWKWTTCGELAAREPNAIMDGPFGSKLKTEHYTNTGARVIRLGNIQPLQFVDENKAFISMKYYRELKAHEVRSGDLLIAALGEPLGRTCRVPGNLGPAIVKADCLRYRPADTIEPDYLVYWLNSPEGRISIDALSHGIGRKRINTKDLRRVTVPVAPIGQQRIIVAELDSLLETSRTAREELGRVAKLVERYKQAILSAAFRGDLSTQPRDDWPSKPLCEIADLQLGKMLDKAKNKGVLQKYLRNVNVRWFAFDLSDLLEMRISKDEQDKFSIRDGDVLICEGGEPGRAAVWRGGNTQLAYQKALHRVRAHPGYTPEWVVYQLLHATHTGALSDYFTGTTIKHLPQQTLAQLPFLAPPEDVQKEVVAAIERAFSAIDQLSVLAESALTLLDRLDQATLAKAFRGELLAAEQLDMVGEEAAVP